MYTASSRVKVYCFIVKGKIQFTNPEINTDTRINLIRVTIPNPGKQLKPGMQAYVVIKSSETKSLSLLSDAVFRAARELPFGYKQAAISLNTKWWRQAWKAMTASKSNPVWQLAGWWLSAVIIC